MSRPVDDHPALLAAKYLALLAPGVQPLALFTQFARLTVLATVEVALLAQRGGRVAVLLSRRPDSCPWWPGCLHVPGTALLASDEDDDGGYGAAVTRLLGSEFKDSVVLEAQPRCYDARRRAGVRGSELTAFCWAPVRLAPALSAPVGGRFFDLEDIVAHPPAEGLLDGHERTLAGALAAYRARC